MNKYLFIYRMPTEVAEVYHPSPEEMQEQMAQWETWKEQFAEAIVSLGDGLKPEGKTLREGDTLHDGPYVEAKELIGGYSIVQAESYEAAAQVALACPIRLVPGNSVEIRELAGY